MALKSGAKSRQTRPLPPPCEPVRWLTQVTGEAPFPWQADLLRTFTAEDRPRVAYVQVPRKNGKTRLAALLALAEACLKERRHIYAVSDSDKNLKSTLMRELRDLVGAADDLRDSVHVFQHHLEVPATGSFIEARPNNFAASQGINPHLVLFDEVHLQRGPETWAGMQMAGAARPDALLLGITTPGYDVTSLAHELYTAVMAGDPTVYGYVSAADPAAHIDDRAAWRAANPCFDRPGFEDALQFDRDRLPEHEFRRFRLGQWTATEQAWLPYGSWAQLAVDAGPPARGTRIWAGFDGSYSGDSTALVGATAEGYVWVIGCWENPGRTGWRVPRADVHERVAEMFGTWDVAELLCDPPYWGAEIADWRARWPNRVLEFPTYVHPKMAPACTTFYSAVLEGSVTHDGDPRLARHLGNAVVKSTPQGDVITKPDKDSPAKIDLAVAAVIAYAAAAGSRRPPRRPIFAAM